MRKWNQFEIFSSPATSIFPNLNELLRIRNTLSRLVASRPRKSRSLAQPSAFLLLAQLKTQPTMSKPTPLPTGQYTIFIAILALHSIIGGYWAGTRPNGAGWRFFSWHPLLMMLGEYNDYFVIMGRR